MADDSEVDLDRAAILARRRRFVVVALGGLSGVGGCTTKEVSPSPTTVSPGHVAPAELAPDSVPELARGEACPAPIPHLELDEVSKRARADQLIERAEQARAEGDPSCATTLFEGAYYLTPSEHDLALSAGESAYEAGDSEKARAYLERYLTHGQPSDDVRARVEMRLDELPDPEPAPPSEPEPFTHGAPQPCLNVSEPRRRVRRRSKAKR